MSAEAKQSWQPALPRWPTAVETNTDARQTTARRPTRMEFARIAESLVPDSLQSPSSLFELAVKYVPTKFTRIARTTRHRTHGSERLIIHKHKYRASSLANHRPSRITKF